MSHTELEARRWQAAVDAAWGKRDDISVKIEPEHTAGQMAVTLRPKGWMDGAAWFALAGETRSRIYLYCTKAEWAEMLAQGGK